MAVNLLLLNNLYEDRVHSDITRESSEISHGDWISLAAWKRSKGYEITEVIHAVFIQI